MNPIILYDGVCALCNHLVRFVLERDRRDEFHFAAIQSNVARAILERHGVNPDALDTVYLVLDYGQPTEQLASRSQAVALVCAKLKGVWRLCARVMTILPPRLRDWAYDFMAAHRYRWFGKYRACPLPRAEERHKFLDLNSADAASPQ